MILYPELKPVEQMTESELTQFYSRCMEDYHYFAQMVLGHVDMNKEHLDLCRFLEGDGKFKLVLMPRYTFKSCIITQGVTLWKLLQNPDERILIYSDSATKAQNFLLGIKNHIEGKTGRSRFREFFSGWETTSLKGKWNDSQITISLRKAASVEPSVDTGGIETSKVGMHYDCLLPDTEIYSSNGWKKAKDIYKGCRVLSSDGKFNIVSGIIKKLSTKKIIRLRSKYQSFYNEFTEDHKILVYRNGNSQWIEAKDITLNDYFVIPLLKGRNHNLSRTNKELNKMLDCPDIWRLIGYWLAEGCASDNNTIRMTFNKTEDSYINDIKQIVKKYIGKDIKVSETKSSTKMIYFSDKNFKTIINTFGTHAYNKHIPPYFLNNSFSLQRELLVGYFRGDGCLYKNVISFTSISKDLLTGVQLLLAKVNIQSTFNQSNKAGKAIVVGNECNIKDSWSLSTTSHLAHILFNGNVEFPVRPFRSFFTDKYWCVPVEEILSRETEYEYDVYDIQVNKSNDFYCAGMIVHNCIIFDDIVSDLNVTTKAQMDKVHDCYKKSLSLLKPGGEVVLTGTRWHFGDCYGRIIEENKQKGIFNILIKKAEENGDLFFDDIGDDGLTREFLNRQKSEQGSHIYSCIYQNNPVSDDSALFKHDDFQFYGTLKPSENPSRDGLYPNLYITGTLDPAGEGEDFTAGTICGTSAKRQIYVLELLNKRSCTPTEMIDWIFRMNRKYRLVRFGVETIFFRGMFERLLNEKIQEEMARDNSFNNFGVEKFLTRWRHGEGKKVRIEGLQPYHERGDILFPGSSVEELKGSFGDLAYQMMQTTRDHMPEPNDLLDALSWQIDIVQKGGTPEPGGPPKNSPAWLEQQWIGEYNRMQRRLPRRLRHQYQPSLS